MSGGAGQGGFLGAVGGSLRRILAIASNAFREAVRNRAFVGLMLLAFAFLVFSLVMSALAVSDQSVRVVLDFGLFSISLFGVLIAIVMGVILVHKEIEKKTIFTIIPKPIHRFEFILGKYLGMLAILVVEVGGLAAVWLLLLWAKGGPVGLEVGKALVLIFFEVMVVTSVALLFSSFSSPVLSGIFAGLVFVVGRVVHIIDEMLRARGGLFGANPELRPIGRAVVAVFPDLSVFIVDREVLLGVPVEWSYLAASAGYAASYIAVFLGLAVLLFERRDFV